MKFEETHLGGAWVVALEVQADERGHFARTFDRDDFGARGMEDAVVQCNVSYNRCAGTLRGMHYQADPHGEPKLVRCTRGGLWDVIVDLRPASQTFRAWFGIELTAHNATMLYVPTGMAHGYQTLTDDTEVHYQMGREYVPGAGRGVRWDDPAFGISWPDPPTYGRVISERDASYPDFG